MNLALSVQDNESVLAVSGDVDVPGLRSCILAVLDQNRGDVLLDMRQASPVSDDLMAALAAVRSHAKHLHHRIVVVDAPDGGTGEGLRRHGMHIRIPIYLDPACATAGLQADRDARARLRAAGRPMMPGAVIAHGDVADDSDDDADYGVSHHDEERPPPPRWACRTLWSVHSSVGPSAPKRS